jgi:hypothetical protein
MQLITTGWWLRQQARAALAAGDTLRAARLARAAVDTHATPAACDLLRLASVCAGSGRD